MNEQGIFLAALDIADPVERAAFVNRTCAGDPTLRQQVEALLTAHERSGEFLDVPALQQMEMEARTLPPLPCVSPAGPGQETGAEQHGPSGEIELSFLQPSTKPGSLGRLGHYEIEEVIGRGGCGIVLKAFDELLQRVVAIKVIAPELAATSPARKRFLREARAAAAIRHDNVVSIHAVEDQPIPFLVMEYVPSQTLQQKLDKTGPLEAQEVVQIGQQIASGLAAAHAKGLIHRDIKPANILLEGEPRASATGARVKITDFGLARTADDASVTQSGMITGTPLYMSPEQALSQPIDQRSDLFSLGSVLYVMCSGRPPFRAGNTVAVLMRVAEDQPRPIQEIIPEVPEWLIAIIAKLLAKKPADRFASAQEVANLLARCWSEMQHRGRVESLGDVLPMIPKPANAVREPGESERPRTEDRPVPAPDKRPPLPCSRRWVAAAAVLLALLGGLSLTEATGVTNVRGTVIRLFSADGTLVVEVDDPGVSVSIDGEEMVITGTGAKEIRLKPGQYKVLASKDGKLVRQELVTVTRNGRQVVRVSKEVEQVMASGDRPKTEAPLSARFKNTLGMEFALVPKGKAWLGGGGGKAGDKEVEFKEDFYLGVYEVTQEEWEKVMGLNPSHFKEVEGVAKEEQKRFPVESVSWDDAQVFVQRLNEKVKEAGWEYRLPTEQQWEYACRGGPMKDKLESAFDFYLEKPANLLLPDQANFNQELKQTRKVGSYQPNRLGLYDTHGNVWELCADEIPENPKDPKSAMHRVIRGGCWSHDATHCLAATSHHRPPSVRNTNLGLRVARVRVGTDTPPSTLVLSTPPPSAALEALRREQIPPEALKMAGDGDPNKAPASLVAVLGEALPIHTGMVNSVAFSPDGRWLASGSDDKSILLRDGSTGRVSRVLQGHSGPVSSVAFSKDGRMLVSASHDGTLKLWPVEKVSEPETLELKLGEVHTLAASPDGRFLAAGGTTGVIKLWKWGQWNKPVDLPALPGKVHALAFSANGELLGSSEGQGADSRVRLYQTSDGKLTLSWEAGKSPVHALAFHRDGKWLATTGGSKFVRLWDVASGKLVSETGEWIHWEALAFHPNGKTLYVFLPYNRGFLFELPGLKPSARTGRDVFLEPSVRSAAYSPDGKFLAFGAHSGGVVVWDIVKWEKQLPKQGHSHYLTRLAMSPDGRTVLAGDDDNVLRRWDIGRPGESHLVNRFDRSLIDVVWSPDGKKFATTALFEWYDDDQRGVVWDASTGKQLFKIDQPQLVHNAAFSPDSRLLAGCSHRIDCVKLWDANNGKELHRFPKVGVCLDRPAFSADGKLLAVATHDTKAVKVWDVASGEEVHSWEDVPMCAVALSRDGRLLAAGHFDGTISLWDLSVKERKKRTLGGHSARINVLKFTPDGKTLVSSGDDGTIRLWNHAQERALREIISIGPAKKPLRFDLDPSGKYLFAAGDSPLIYGLRLAEVPLGAGTTAQSPPRYKNSLGMEFALVPKGKSWLGGDGGKVGDKEVEFKDDFYLGVYEVTQEEWTQVMGKNPSHFSRKGEFQAAVKDVADTDLKRFPVEHVSWHDCREFVARLNEKLKESGWVYRMPTEAEWEYACRGGSIAKSDMAFDFYLEKPTNTLLPVQANVAHAGLGRTCMVGTYAPNRLGLRDMHGNVWEWCDDELPDNQRVLRGGTFGPQDAGESRAAFRAIRSPDLLWRNNGLRVARARAGTADPDRRAAEWVLSIGGRVRLFVGGGVREIHEAKDLPAETFGVEIVNLHANQKVTDAGLAHCQGLTNVAQILLINAPVTDAGLVHLRQMKSLGHLDLQGTRITDAGLVNLQGLTNLGFLNLYATKLTDTGLLHLKGLTNLTTLHVHRTVITDAGLDQLTGLKRLTLLDLRQTKVTESGVKKLATALPGCKFEWDGGVIEPKGASSTKP